MDGRRETNKMSGGAEVDVVGEERPKKRKEQGPSTPPPNRVSLSFPLSLLIEKG